MLRNPRISAVWLGLTLLCAGCPAGWSWRDFDADKRLDLSEEEEPGIEGRNAAVFKNSIAEKAWFEGMRRMRVQGYGVVVGLGDRGSTSCPRQIRSRVLDELYKRPAFKALRFNKEGYTPERLIDDPGTAVVQVQGEIPAAAVAGSRFDVSVSAIPGDETTSLRGGRLIACDLHIYRMLSRQAGLMGKSLADSQGPLFMNPFSDRPGAATRSVSRVATIMGGGRVTTDRRIRLALFKPSYTTAKRIASRINARFPNPKKVADAESPSYIKLSIPSGYAADTRHFLELIQHLYIKQDASYATRQARLLAELITKAGASHEDIALAWEGLGRSVLSTIGKLYTHDDPFVSYYAALAGLRLGDPVAVQYLAVHADNDRSPLRFQAVEALGAAREVFRAEGPLVQLIDSPDPLMRVAAYEALLERRSPAIQSRLVGRDNFALDALASSGPPIVYAKRTGSRRVVVLGGPVHCQPPLFYRHAGGDLTVNARPDDSRLTVLYKTSKNGSAHGRVEVGMNLTELIETLGQDLPRFAGETDTGLGVDYALIIQLLQELSDTHSMDAKFMIEQTTIKELFGPMTPSGRPESELE